MEENTSNSKGPDPAAGAPAPTPRSVWVIVMGVFVVVALAAGVVIMVDSSPRASTSMPMQNAPPTANASTVAPAAGPVQTKRPNPSLGPANAPVKIEEYGDFGCPTCRAWYMSDALSRLRSEYGDKIQFIWHDYPIITAESPRAAEAGQCAYDQGKFWEYHDYLYAHPEDLYGDGLKTAAAKLQLDTQVFGQCLDFHKYTAQINQDLQDGKQLKLIGTPTFIINNKRELTGVPTFENFAGLIT
jgi:protein-disulfide isomerase